MRQGSVQLLCSVTCCAAALSMPLVPIRLLPGYPAPAIAASLTQSARQDALETVLDRSFTASRTSLHSVQATEVQTLTQANTPKSFTERTTGSCAVSPVTLAVRSSYVFSIPGARKVAGDYVLISDRHSSHAWGRSASSRKWSTVSIEGIEAQILGLCPSIFLRGILEILQRQPTRLVDLGGTTVDGHATVHLRARTPRPGNAYTVDYYIDRTSFFPVRVEMDQRSGSNHGHLLAQFRDHNVPVRIGPPKAAETLPVQGSELYQITVTPNPAPAGSALTVSMTAPTGSRCAAQLVVRRFGHVTGATPQLALGTRVVGASRVAQWTRAASPDWEGGSALVACTLGRSTTNQVGSFVVFP